MCVQHAVFSLLMWLSMCVQILSRRDDRGVMDELTDKLDLKQVMDRNVENLSGGELQRFAIAVCAASKSDVYMVDEPSSYLDVRQRLKAAQVRRFSVCAERNECVGGKLLAFCKAVSQASTENVMLCMLHMHRRCGHQTDVNAGHPRDPG
jgi:ABC-type transport system involved in cytochrome c biogenesis ATPase subunit